MTATRKWSALAVLLVAAIFVASWFLLIAPKRSEASGLRAQKAEQDATNQRLIEQLEVLKAQAQDLPKQEAFLAQIRRQVPNNPALPALIRDLTAGAKKSGVDIISLAPALPIAVVAPVATTVAVPTTAGTAAPSPTTTPAAGAVTVPSAAAPVLYQVPITVKTSGSYFETEQFLNKIEGLKRSFLVTGFTLKYAQSTSENPTAGPLEMEIKGRVFLSPAAAVAAGATVPVPGATTTPAPSTAPAAN
jgi:type IV pilus assembly protein PilO